MLTTLGFSGVEAGEKRRCGGLLHCGAEGTLIAAYEGLVARLGVAGRRRVGTGEADGPLDA